MWIKWMKFIRFIHIRKIVICSVISRQKFNYVILKTFYPTDMVFFNETSTKMLIFSIHKFVYDTLNNPPYPSSYMFVILIAQF